MRLCNALIQYSVLFSLSLFIYHCDGHEHPNHIDPVATKYSGSAGTVDPLAKPIETANVPKTDFQQHHEDEHLQDTIDARLQAKHHLRQSVHQHTDDDKHEDDYINRLNSALENNNHQFQYAAPPIADTVNHTSPGNQTKEGDQVPLHVQNETIPSNFTPEQPQQISDEIVSSEKVEILEQQQIKDSVEQNIVKEDILFTHKETIPITPSHPPKEETLNVPKSTIDPVPSSSDSKEPKSDIKINEALEKNDTLDVRYASSTPLEADEAEQKSSDDRQVNDSSDSNLEQPKASVPMQNTSSVDVKPDQQQLIPEPIEINHLEQANTIGDSVQNNKLVESDSLPPTPIEENRQPSVIDTPITVEREPNDIELDEHLFAPKEQPTEIHSSTPPPPTTRRILRSATSRLQQNIHAGHLHAHTHTKPEEPKPSSTIETTTPVPILENSIDEENRLPELPPIFQPEEPHVETSQSPSVELDLTHETDTQINEPIDIIDLPRQVHVHDPQAILDELKEETTENENENENENGLLDEHIDNTATVDSFLINDHSPHLPRILENEEPVSTFPTVIDTLQATETATEAYLNPVQNDSKTEETNNTLMHKSNTSETLLTDQYRQLCWRLPKPLEPSFGLVENQLLRIINLLPEFLQTTLFGGIDDREALMNTIWFGSICTMCFLFSLIFLSLGAKRLKQTKHEKEIRARCQQLQQYNNQIELERATFERQNQKLSDEIDELKNLPVRDADEEIFELRERYEQLHADWKIARSEHDGLKREIDHRQSLMQKHEFEMQKQVEAVAYLNNEILRQKQELETEREKVARVQSNDLSLERFEKLQEIIREHKSEITQLKQDKFAKVDQLQQVQEQANQLDIDKNELTIKMKQMKDLLEQRDETIARIREKMLDDNDDEEKATEIGDILSNVAENNPENSQQQQLLSTIDNDVEKANQHMRDLHTEIEDKTRRVKELDTLLNQEKDRCRELETKLKVVLELRERDAHLHIRQLGHTDAELRKARTDTERVRILQQQLEFKQKELDDVQKVLGSEQTKFSEDCSKLQHEIHEKWMEVKRLTRELDGARKECEGLRRQITKYANNDRSSQEKTMHKPVPQHLNNTGRLSSEPETNGSSPPTLPYQQGDNFRPIDHERSDSGAASPSEMFKIRPTLFGLARPPFFPPPFMHHPPHNPFLMAPRFSMPVGGPHGLISPIPHIMTNGSGGGSDTNSFEIVDSTNITPNSTSYDVQMNGSAVSPTPNNEQQATAKAKKPKKSLKKKTKTSTTTTVSSTKEDV